VVSTAAGHHLDQLEDIRGHRQRVRDGPPPHPAAPALRQCPLQPPHCLSGPASIRVWSPPWHRFKRRPGTCGL